MRLPDPRADVVAAIPLFARTDIRLFLTSATLLFAELLLIRWIPANVRYVGFFSNFLLMASFLGIGLGILIGRSGRRLPLSPFAVLLLGTYLLVEQAQLNVKVSGANEIFFGLEVNRSADVNFLVLPLVVVLTATLLACLAMPLGPLLRSMPPLRAYAIDIGGSMTGIAAFAAVSSAGLDPTVWFAIVGGGLFLQALGLGITPWSLVSGAAIVAVIVANASGPGRSGDIWSPYYRITAYDDAGARVSAAPGSQARPRHFFVDGIPHQAMLTAAQAAESDLHAQVYRWFPERTFDRVLIIGAGSGTDTALALARGSHSIDAVEIDPELARIGRQFHPDGVYDRPGVSVVVNDGRAFLRGTTKRYDLIVFALTDSLTLVSSTANVRLESFLFTDEALGAARDHLADGGVFVMYNLYREPWLVTKLDAMLADAFGQRPLLRLLGPAEAVLAAGPAVGELGAAGPPGDRVDAVPTVSGTQPRAATDDWPFLYLRTGQVAPYYIAAIGFLLVFGALAVLITVARTGLPRRAFSPHFFVLGAAFLLLETKSIVSFSLLFGTTWLVNALTFFAILASVLLAIFINARFRLRSARGLYVGLGAALTVAYLLPPEALLLDPPWLRYLLASAVAFAPVFVANLVFTQAFRETSMADMAFASNLIGAMVGGALEYVSLVIGFRALLLVVAALYGLAYLLGRRVRWLADRELAPA